MKTYFSIILKSVLGVRIHKNAALTYQVTILKLDRIGDFVLAIGSIKRIVNSVGADDCCLIVNETVKEIAQKIFPEIVILSIPYHRDESSIWKKFKAIISFKLCCVNFRTIQLMVLRHDISVYDELHISAIAPKICIRTNHKQKSLSLQNTILASTSKSQPTQKSSSANPKKGPSPCEELFKHQELINQFLKSYTDIGDLIPKLDWACSDTGPIIFSPLASNPIRDYPVKESANIIDNLLSNVSKDLFLTGTKSQEKKLREIANNVDPSFARRLDIKTELSLLEYIELIATAYGVISIESATAHISIALDKPTVCIIGGGTLADLDRGNGRKIKFG